MATELDERGPPRASPNRDTARIYSVASAQKHAAKLSG